MESPVDVDVDSSDDDDNDNNYDENGLDDSPPLPIDSLAINHFLTDDMYSGAYSKDVYHRVPSQNNLDVRLSLSSELNFYCSNYLRPRLLEILSSNSAHGFFIWIAGSLVTTVGLSVLSQPHSTIQSRGRTERPSVRPFIRPSIHLSILPSIFLTPSMTSDPKYPRSL